MTRKDYVLIADAIKAAKDADAAVQNDAPVYWTARSIANALRRSNQGFDKARFMAACGFAHWE